MNSTLSERIGDAVVTRIPYFANLSGGAQIEVYAHSDGGVTVVALTSDGREVHRISVMRETWAAIVEAASCRS